MTQGELYKNFEKMDEYQKKALEEYINFQMHADVETTDLAEAKLQIYRRYVRDISKLVAKIEVYEHDLPKHIRGFIETAFRALSVTADIDETKALQVCDYVYKYQTFLINTLNLNLIDLYLKDIKKIKKVFNTFKCHSIQVEGVPVNDYLKSVIKEINTLRKCGKDIYDTLYEINEKSLLDGFNVKVKNDVHIIDFEKGCSLSEKALENINKVYATIINNGYDMSKGKRILVAIPDILAVIFTIIGAIILIKELIL